MAEALYRQIAEDLKKQIESGELRPGAQLPTEAELSKKYDRASRNTIREAIRWLVTRGLVTTQPGRGTFVVEELKPFIASLSPVERGIGGGEGDAFADAVREQGGVPSAAEPRVEVQKADKDMVRELRVEPGSSVVVRHQQRFIDGSPSSLQTSFYPFEFVNRGAIALLQAANIEDGVTKYLKETLGIEQIGYRDRLTVRAPFPEEVRFFRIPDDGSVLIVVTRRTAYAEGRKPIRYTVTVYPADRNHFVIDFGEVPPLKELLQDLGVVPSPPEGQ
jgi:GntR family transcriptional regulator